VSTSRWSTARDAMLAKMGAPVSEKASAMPPMTAAWGLWPELAA
jgi:hypothetical protein